MTRHCACGRYVKFIWHRLPNGLPECWQCVNARLKALGW